MLGKPNVRPPLILMGGGLDSTAALLFFRRKGLPCRAIHFQYGQIAGGQELEAVQYFCDKYNVLLKVVYVPIDQIATSGILFNNASTSNKLEGRNAIFVMMAATYAATIGCPYVCLGYHQEPESAPFPDATIEAVKGMQAAIDACYSSSIELICPFINYTRSEILNLGNLLDPEFLSKTHTCYLNIEGGCGECAHCLQKAVMVRNLLEGRDDPLPENS